MPRPQADSKLYAATLLSAIHEDTFYQNYIFEVVFSFATRFGFQAFNPNPLLTQQQHDARHQGVNASGVVPNLAELLQQQHLVALQAALSETNTAKEDQRWARNSAGNDGPRIGGFADRRSAESGVSDGARRLIESMMAGQGQLAADMHFAGVTPSVDPPYVASTMFIAADHLCRVIVDDLMVRNCCINGVDMDTAFSEAVWILHSKLLAAYVKWAEDVMQLPARPISDSMDLANRSHTDEVVIRMLLSELALFMLIYTESANVRHLTDGLSFLFWVARFSPDFQDALNTCPLPHLADICDVEYSVRDAILQFRNECAGQIDAASQALQVGVSSPEGTEAHHLAQACFVRFQKELHGPDRKSPLKMLMQSIATYRAQGKFDQYLVSWVFAISEERPFLEEVIQPMFHFMAYLEDKLGRTGWETFTRLCYEDFNDSLCHPDIVKNALGLLGVADPTDYNPAYSSLCGLGRREEGGVDLDRVAVWWEACIVRKMFYERRGYLRVLRDYFYGHLLPILIFHALVVFAFTAGNPAAYSICQPTNQAGAPKEIHRTNCFNLGPVLWTSLVVTHAIMFAIRDFASAFLSRPTRVAPSFSSFVGLDPSSVALLPDSVIIHQQSHELTPADEHSPFLNPSPWGVSINMIGTVPLYGLPSMLRAAVVCVIFFAQFEPGSTGKLFHQLWLGLASVYIILTVFLHITGTGDGYILPGNRIAAIGWLLKFFEPNNFRYGDPDPSVLRVGRRSHLRTVLLWFLSLPAGFFFAYLATYTLMFELQLLLKDFNVFERGTWMLGDLDTGLPKPSRRLFPVFVLLMSALAACFGLVFFTILMFGSQVMAFLFASRHGLGHYKNWSALCDNFDQAAALWCQKCMHRTDRRRAKMDDDDDVSQGLRASQREHNTFSLIWNSMVEDFYHRDQLSLSEAEALSYLRVAPDQDCAVDMQFPTVWRPPFILGPRLHRELRQSNPPEETSPASALPPAMLDAIKLILWVLHSGGVLDAPELTLLVQPLVTNVPENAVKGHFRAAQELIRQGLAFMAGLCRATKIDSNLQNALQDYLEDSHPELDLEVEFSFVSGGRQSSTPNTQVRVESLNSLADSVQKGMEQKPDLAAAVRYLAQLSELHDFKDSEPEIEIVEDHLRTFVKLLHHKKLGHKGVCPAVCMSPYTTLIPVYKESILPCLDEESAASLLGYGQPGVMPETLDTAKVWVGMLTEIEPGVSQLSFIQKMHPQEWRNFQARVAAQTGLMPHEVQAERFLPGGELHEYEWELLIWCAGRTQLLGRQLPALATYYKATATLMALECPCPHDWSVEQYYDWLKHATGIKYQAVLSLQIIGQKLLRPKSAKDVWDAKGIIAMLNHYPFLRGIYLHDVALPGGDSVQYSVMVQGKYKDVVQEGLIPPRGAAISLATYPSPSILTSSDWRPDPFSGYRPFAITEQYTTALQPVYCLRLPRNYYSERGVIIGSGKPENHNIGMPYVFTDLMQGNDSNMDNLVADALKMRNIVSEHMVVDRFSTVFIPLLKSQVSTEPGLYEVRYNTKKNEEEQEPAATVHAFGALTRVASSTTSFLKRFNSQVGSDTRSSGGYHKAAKASKAVIKPRGVPDGFELGGDLKPVVGSVRASGKAASVQQYAVYGSGSSYAGSSGGSSPEDGNTPTGSAISNNSSAHPSTVWSSRRSDRQHLRPRTHKPKGEYSTPEKQPITAPPSISGASSQTGQPEGPWSGKMSSSNDDGDTIKSFVMKISHRLQQRGDPRSSGVAFADLKSAMKTIAQGAHLAVLGINPWICTSNQGNFAWLNALNEAFFNFNVQSQLQYASRIRYHYGLGDVWNKFWAMTNSGVSRPCTNLHAVEDLPVGVRVVLKGGIIKLRDYMLVGKCRETNIIGMLSYMYKICSGGYESSLGRDYYLLHSRFEPFREAGSWQAITGMVVIFRLWFVGTWVRLHVEMLLLVMDYRKDMFGRDVPSHFAATPQWFPISSNLNAWDLGVLAFWTLFLPFFLYGTAIGMQHGMQRVLRDMLRLHSTLWPMLNFVFCKWWDSIAHMSCHHQIAQYVATGRGFGLHHVPFIYKYCLFVQTLWYYAVVVITCGALLVCDGNYWQSYHAYGHTVTLFVIFTGSMQIMGPFWYTPLSFSLGHVLRDAGDWWGWIHGQVDAYTGSSYSQWRGQQLEPYHNVNGMVEGFYFSWFGHMLGILFRNGVVISFCVHLVYLSSPTRDVIVQFLGLEFNRFETFSYGDLAFVLTCCTAVFWALLFMLCLGYRLASSAAQPKSRPLTSMFLTGFGMVAAGLSLMACYQPFILPVGVKVPWYLIAKNMFAIIAGNFLALGILLQTLTLSRARVVLWVVECIYWGVDLCFGLILQGLLLLFSVTPSMQWLQNVTISRRFGYSAAMCQTD